MKGKRSWGFNRRKSRNTTSSRRGQARCCSKRCERVRAGARAQRTRKNRTGAIPAITMLNASSTFTRSASLVYSTSKSERYRRLQRDEPAPPIPAPAPKPAAAPTPTPCLMLANMFDPAEETNPNFHLEIQEDVQGECARFGQVLHIFVDANSKVRAN